MKKEEITKLINWLKIEQNKLQKKFKKRIPKLSRGYDFRGIWIKVNCMCNNHEFTTPYYINKNGRCPVCKRLFCRGLK